MDLKLEHIDFSYQGKNVFHDFSLNLPDDGLIAIAGNNGSGKTTLLKLLAGIAAPTAGNIFADGVSYRQRGDAGVARLVSYVPQFLQTVFDLPVLDFLLLTGGKNLEINTQLEAAYTALERTGMQMFARRCMNQLSGGERQKILIAAAVFQNAPLMLLDEPVSHLDWSGQLEIFRLLRQIAESEKKKVLVVVHDMNLAASYCNYILLLKHGNAVAYGETGQVLTPETIHNVFGLHVRTVENYFVPLY